MERKNMVLLTVIAVATLLVAVVGATFAYFTATVSEGRTEGDGQGQGSTELTTAKVASTITTANITGAAGSFTATDVFPGHMEVAGLSVKVEADAGTYAIPFLYDVETNTIGSDVKYYLYSAETDETVNINCTLGTSGSGEIQYSETCDFTNATSVGQKSSTNNNLTLVATGNLNASGAQKIEMLDHITVSSESATKYYYFVVEYHNNGDQTGQEGTSLKGTITLLGITKE